MNTQPSHYKRHGAVQAGALETVPIESTMRPVLAPSDAPSAKSTDNPNQDLGAAPASASVSASANADADALAPASADAYGFTQAGPQMDAKFAGIPVLVPTSKGETELDFYRVLVRRAGETKNSTVSVPKADYKRMLHFAYGNKTLLHGALREAALRVVLPAVQLDAAATITGQTRKRQDFSAAVRAKALKSLQGAYRPEVAAFHAARSAMTAEERGAAENNSEWAAYD